jgi:hypothetical protein
MRFKMDLFRHAYRALAEGGDVVDADGEAHDPQELFATAFVHSVVEFGAHFRPGWMSRGPVWPTRLLDRAGMACPAFESPARLFQSLPTALVHMRTGASSTIVENYTAGGYVRAERVGEVRALFEAEADRILAPAKAEGWERDCRREMRKLVEALRDAELRGHAFIEATEIYSGSMGIMN